MIAKSITSAPFSDGITAPQRRTGLISMFFKIAKPLFLLLLMPILVFSAARATPVPGATITLNGGQTVNVFSSDSFTVTFTTAQTGLSASNFTVPGSVTGAFVSSVTGSGTSWTVTVTIPGSFQSQGTFTLTLANSANLSPGLSGLPIAGPAVQVIAYPLDGTLSLSSTNANSGYAKTGDKINFTLQSAHYEVENWGVNVAGQNANGSSNFSTVATGQVTLGSGTAQGALAWSWNYTNQFNEPTSGSGTSGIIFDSVNPTVSISAPSAGSTSTTPVTYNVTYADANFNTSTLSTSNITLNSAGSANGTVTLVQNSATNYTVTISNITGSGTLGISVAAGTASDMAGNLAPASSPSTTFTVVSAIPTTTSLSANPNPSYTVAPNHTVVFTATVTSSGNPVTSGTVTFTSDGRNITDIASGQTILALNGNGTATLTTSFDTVATHKIQATYSGNSTYATSTSTTVNQQVILHPTTISSLTATDALVTNAATVNYTATFASAVTGLTASNFTLSGTGINNAAIGTPTSSNNITWNIPVTTGDDGTLLLAFANATNLSPGVSNTSFNADHTYTIDKTAPTVSSIAATTPGNTNPTNATSVSYTVTFSKAVTGVSGNAFIATATNTVASTGIAVTPVSSSVYTVTVSGISGDGTLRLDLNSSGTGITDLAGNAISGGFTGGDIYNIDQTPPVTTVVNYNSTSSAPAGWANSAGDVLMATVSFNEQVQTPVITIGGHAVTAVNTSGNTWTGSYTLTPSDPEEPYIFDVKATDIAGNASEYNSGNDGYVITFDKTPPAVNIGAPSTTLTRGGPVTYNIIFFDSNFKSGAVGPGQITLNVTGTATANVDVDNFGVGAKVTLSNITGDGLLGISVYPGTTVDQANNRDIGAGPSATFMVDNTPPKATISAPSVTQVNTGGSGSVSYTVTYADDNFNTSNLSITGITLNTTGTATGTVGVTGSGTTYTVTISNITGLGALGISIAGGYASDNAGNTDLGAGPSASFNVLSTNDNLSSLKMSKGIFSPVFTSGATSYSDAVGNAITSVTVTPTAADPTATITVNGTVVPSGTASGAIDLNVGNNTISVVVTAQDGTTSKTYTVTVTRAPSNNDNLSSLKMSKGIFSPAFTSATTSYTDAVGNTITSVAVTPTTADPTATVKVNGTAVTSGAASSPINLNIGPNTVNVTVTAQDGTTTKTYTVIVTRAGTSNDNLSSLKVSKGIFSPTFASATTGYNDAVGNTITSVTITPAVSDTGARVQVNGTAVPSGTASGAIDLNVGDNTINVVVTASDKVSTKTYTVTVTRAGNSNDNLTSLKMSKGIFSPTFASATTSYADAVGNTITSVTVTPTTSDPDATIQVNGTAVTSGTASDAINLNVGNNTINVVVTASDKVTTKTYTVTVTRAGNNNDNLTSLKMSKGTFSPTFAGATTSYTDAVNNPITSVTVTPTASDPDAAIQVNGTPVASGTASGAINLAVGANTINVLVTASDKVTTKTYVVTVNRASGGADSYGPGISVTKPTETPALAEDGIQVHQGVSPNGDGVNDFLMLDGIQAYPDNKLSIMNRNGQLIYEAKGYDNSSKTFDGHSNKNGKMQLPGTYFYQLDYTVNGAVKHKTGFIVLKY